MHLITETKHVGLKLIEIREEAETSTVMVGEFTTPFLVTGTICGEKIIIKLL